MLRVTAILAITMGLAACGKSYPMIPETTPSAVLTFDRTPNSRTLFINMTGISIFENPDCEETEFSGGAALIVENDPRLQIRVQAGQPIWVITDTYSVRQISPFEEEVGGCARQVGFLPVAGQRYQAIIRTWMDECSIQVVQADGTPINNTPDSLPPEGCRGVSQMAVNRINNQRARQGKPPIQ